MWIFTLLLLTSVWNTAHASQCSSALSEDNSASSEQAKVLPTYPRQLDPGQTFDALVKWMHDDLIVAKQAPGFVVGLSGTDSILAFLAAAKAFEQAGKPGRVVGIHYGDPAESWFATDVVPWLREKAPGSKVIIDNSINHNRDGARWGALLDWSVVEDLETGMMRQPSERFWVLGTRNATETALGTYSNISMAASVQPISHFWKSEVLALNRYLGVPLAALERSCDVDCPCGRHQLAALNIPEIDALLMTRAGDLSPDYARNNIPPTLLGQLNNYIDEQMRDTSFKTQIPYVADNSLSMQTSFKAMDQFVAAKAAVQTGASNSKLISQVVPQIIASKQTNLAADLVVTDGPNREAWLGEALTLFNTPGLRNSQKRQMVQKVFGDNDLSVTETKAISTLSARIGYYGFSFPQWRFLTQRLDGQPALAEKLGMVRLTRGNDVRRNSLDPSDPARDEWGVGFVWSEPNIRVEYRRAYILVSERTESGVTTTIIRNNSYYFGRDRLDHAAYVSWQPLSPFYLENLKKEDLESAAFVRFDALLHDKSIKESDKIKRLDSLLNQLDKFNLTVDRWLKTAGQKHLAEFLRLKLESGKIGPSLFLTTVVGASPSWGPNKVFALSHELLFAINNSNNFFELISGGVPQSRLVMMSGEEGDYP